MTQAWDASLTIEHFPRSPAQVAREMQGELVDIVIDGTTHHVRVTRAVVESDGTTVTLTTTPV